MSIVDTMAGQAIALFALILVIFQFVIENGELSDNEILSASAMVIAAIFVMLAFALRVVAGLRMVFFNLQVTAVRYAGLVLFLGMYFILLSRPLPSIVVDVFGFFLMLTWVTWLGHEIHYIVITERDEWKGIDKNRREWSRELLSHFRDKGSDLLNI